MKKVLILCAHRPRRSPSQRYRFEQYLSFLEQHGFSFTYSFLLDETDDKVFYSQGNFWKKVRILIRSLQIRRKDLRRFGSFDIIFIQREAVFFGTSYFEKKARDSATCLIFDFDDSIWLADTSPGNKKWEWLKRPAKFFETLTYADCVIAGNRYLAEKARDKNTNVVVIPTSIDTDIHIPKSQLRNQNHLVIGWSGSLSTIKHFEILLPVLQKLKETYQERIKIKVLADGIYKSPSLEIEGVRWTADSEVDVINSFDIGLMPLPDDEWSRGKCGLKGLSYMACGVSTIMSPVGVNSEIISDKKNGLLATTNEDWQKAITFLIENKEERIRLGDAGRKTVEEKYSVAANKEKYLQVFTKNCS